MSVGIQVSKATIDGLSGAMIIELEDLFARMERFSQFLAATPDATLQAAPYAYTSGEVAVLKSFYVADLPQLLTIYRGTANLSSAKNFRIFGKQLWGAGIL